MNRIIRRLGGLGICAILAACGGTTTSEGIDMDDPPVPFVLPAEFRPNLTATQIDGLRDAIAFAEAQERTQRSEILPRGTARYTGAANLTMNLPDQNARVNVIGTMTGSAQLLFSGDRFSATIGNLNLISAGRARGRMLGELNMSGFLDDGTKRVSGTIAGNLRGYASGTTLTQVNVSGAFAGSTGDEIGVRTSILRPPPEFEAAVISGTISAGLDNDNNLDFTDGTLSGSFGLRGGVDD